MPVSTSTASEKLRTILLPSTTAVALSAGVELLKVGATASTVVKDKTGKVIEGDPNEIKKQKDQQKKYFSWVIYYKDLHQIN